MFQCSVAVSYSASSEHELIDTDSQDVGSGGLFSKYSDNHPTHPSSALLAGSAARPCALPSSTTRQFQRDAILKVDAGRGKDLITELDAGVMKGTQECCHHGESDKSSEIRAEWAIKLPKEKENRGRASEILRQHIEVEDLEEEPATTTDDPTPKYFFDKLSDVPAVRDPREIEAADRALETLGRHELTTADRVWELAARGGSTQAGDSVPLDHETKRRVAETLRKKKLTDKTTLAF